MRCDVFDVLELLARPVNSSLTRADYSTHLWMKNINKFFSTFQITVKFGFWTSTGWSLPKLYVSTENFCNLLRHPLVYSSKENDWKAMNWITSLKLSVTLEAINISCHVKAKQNNWAWNISFLIFFSCEYKHDTPKMLCLVFRIASNWFFSSRSRRFSRKCLRVIMRISILAACQTD